MTLGIHSTRSSGTAPDSLSSKVGRLWTVALPFCSTQTPQNNILQTFFVLIERPIATEIAYCTFELIFIEMLKYSVLWFDHNPDKIKQLWGHKVVKFSENIYLTLTHTHTVRHTHIDNLSCLSSFSSHRASPGNKNGQNTSLKKEN